ncbi:MAG: hypothetical protein N3B18_00470 [Desulfobacterota bacterium]|nr:hypothetical protein [Thermodesulfobacteriota bacterium]
MEKALSRMMAVAVFCWVVCGIGAETVSYAQDNETEALEAIVHITPSTYNLKRNGQFLNAIITLPAGYNAADVDGDSLSLSLVLGDNETSEAVDALSAKPVPFLETMLNVKFSNRDVKELIQAYYDTFPTNVTFLIVGSLESGTVFSGKDSIRVIYPGNKGKGGKDK